MRLRIRMVACAVAVLGSLLASGPAGAAPRHNHHLTIAAVPDPILAGDNVLIYGRLSGPESGGQTIWLYHRLDGSRRGFTLIGRATTNSFGEYEFTRAENVVMTNRDWFVRGPGDAHSRTIHERVAALLTISASPSDGDTSHPIAFTGHVTPDHAFRRVLLQKQNPTTGNWNTIARGFVGADSNYLIVHRFRVPGGYALRAILRGNARNIGSASDTVNLVIQQAQLPGFTIGTSDPIVSEDGSATISGVLEQPRTSNPEPNTVVQLWGRHADGPFVVLADATTGSDGSYSFNQTGLTTSTVYEVATMRLPHTRRRHTARLFEGVADVVTMQPSTDSAPTGQIVTFTGTVLPDKTGHVVYLQKLGRDGQFHTVAVGLLRPGSTFHFNWRMGSPGTYTFRARVPRDEQNIGAVSSPVSVTATLPAESSLPPAQ
jgi:hypothetical protein